MGLFDGLFRKDPTRELNRAEEMLDDGRPYPALQVVQRVKERGALPERVAALERRCHEALGEAALAEADFMETEGDFADASEWVRSAIRQLGDDHERLPELRRRLKTLRARAREAETKNAMTGFIRVGGEDEPDGPDPLTTEMHFGALVGTLRDDVADLYLSRPLAFQQACVDLSNGRFDEARSAFDQLLVAEPDDPIFRLERGRCRLMAGEPVGAREDLEAVWPALGDEPLDQAEELSVPLLWAEACLDLDDPEAVIQGLTDLAGFAHGTDPVSEPAALVFGRALLAAGRLEEAVDYLQDAVDVFGIPSAVTRLLADALVRTGQVDQAIDLLQQKIAPSCVSGSCGAPRLDVAAARTLATLYLDQTPDGEEPTELVGGLIARISQVQGGLVREDLPIVARYQRMSGQDEAAGQTEAEIERLDRAE